MVRALAGDSTMTRFFGTAGSVAPGPSRTLTRSDLADAAQEVLVDLQVGLGLGFGGRCRQRIGSATSSANEGSLPVMALRRDLDEPDVEVREEEDRARSRR